ncbi:hypothetical protein BEWA_048590 [Theileria equi strain WA]|uniref:Uncharacterized protein n=1 Tax=Theileria equi strain WA TaxID=1537102 RepID=L1LAA4_THEEQ|nr:hypothetical protein BEWA_048590 [Theileria equi strain WA]EKX72392.1 hypothetical protein BEWA_048590 [Theileria equi strain WA]|eukprot:XP_004831844.1 hypothetical protein BEWA_048590 [Theileria equi strain WA]
MTAKVSLDIGPIAFKNGTNGIKREKIKDNKLKYHKYEYKSSDGSSFILTKLLYNNNHLVNLIFVPDLIVNKVVTYFNTSNKVLLLISLENNEKCYYYVNKNAKNSTNGHGRFSSFITLDKGSLRNDEIEYILNTLTENAHFDASTLYKSLKGKLQYLTKDITIDLTRTFTVDNKNIGSYDSGYGLIHYKRFIRTGYTIVQHYAKFDFRVRRIKFDGDHFIESYLFLPPEDDLIESIEVYYNGNSSTKYPLSICFLYNGIVKKWILRNSGDINWTILDTKSGNLEGELNTLNVVGILSARSIPKVLIDLSRDSSYKPRDNTIDFYVAKEEVEIPNLFKLKHYRIESDESGNAPFKVHGVMHGTIPLVGIKSNDKLESVSAYYYGTSIAVDKLLLVELRSQNGDTFRYYERTDKKGESMWSTSPESGGRTTQVNGNELNIELERLKKEYILDLPRIDSSNSSSGAIAGAVIGGLACVVALGVLIWKVGPSVRIYMASRRQTLL